MCWWRANGTFDSTSDGGWSSDPQETQRWLSLCTRGLYQHRLEHSLSACVVAVVDGIGTIVLVLSRKWIKIKKNGNWVDLEYRIGSHRMKSFCPLSFHRKYKHKFQWCDVPSLRTWRMRNFVFMRSQKIEWMGKIPFIHRWFTICVLMHESVTFYPIQICLFFSFYGNTNYIYWWIASVTRRCVKRNTSKIDDLHQSCIANEYSQYIHISTYSVRRTKIKRMKWSFSRNQKLLLQSTHKLCLSRVKKKIVSIIVVGSRVRLMEPNILFSLLNPKKKRITMAKELQKPNEYVANVHTRWLALWCVNLWAFFVIIIAVWTVFFVHFFVVSIHFIQFSCVVIIWWEWWGDRVIADQL